MTTRRKFYADLAERTAWTFVQGFAAAWIVLAEYSSEVLEVASVAATVAVAKGLVATQIGAPNTAATLPTTTDTERG